MTDTMDGQQQTDEGQQENANLKHLRERAEAATAAEQRAAAAERKIAIMESGIDANHPMGKFFLDHYDGDITDTQALVEQAKAMGIPLVGQTPQPGDGTQQPAQQQQIVDQGQQTQQQEPVDQDNGTQQRRALAGEDPNLGDTDEDPRKGALETAQAAIDRGATYEQAGAHMVSQLASAAKRGDTRVIITEERGTDGRVRQRWAP